MAVAALAPLEGDRLQIDAVLGRLGMVQDAETRADLAGELVRLVARVEDAKERAVYPALRNGLGETPELTSAERDQVAVREAMAAIDGRTRHVKPINAHMSDPEGFEESLNSLVDAVVRHANQEDGDLLPLIGRLDASHLDALHHDLERAVAHASSHPKPPHNPIGRAMVNLGDKIDRTFHDTATTGHPGLDQLPDQ